MTDSIEKIASDLAKYLRREQKLGTSLYFDEGVINKDPDEEQDPFIKYCSEFVAVTLGLLKSQKQFETPELPLKEKEVKLAEMNEEVAVCESCKLAPSRTNTVFGTGSPDANIVFVGEAPGKNEDLEGKPFVGRSGKLLTGIIDAIKFSRDDVFICNILKCRPPENRDPAKDEVLECEPFLKQQLEIIRPKVICCLGRHAAMTLLRDKSSLADMRLKAMFYEGIPVIVTYHPAALLRNPNWKRPCWDDMRKLRALHDELMKP
jgi:uracil-DNA glycosylase